MQEHGGLIVVGRAEPSRPRETVEHPTRLLRIATMVQELLEQVRAIPLDERARHRFREIHERTLRELKGLLSEDLREELESLVPPMSELPTEGEVRVAQAQLAGWLEGLLHGIQAALWAQHLAARAQFEEMRRRALEAHREREERQAASRYL